MSASEVITYLRFDVAFRVHAGGLVAGAVLILLFEDDGLVAKHMTMARYA